MRVCEILLLALAIWSCDAHPFSHCTVSAVAKNVTVQAVQIGSKIYTVFALGKDGSLGKNFQTTDYFKCTAGDPKELPTYTNRTVAYIAYDPNTAGYGSDLLIGLQRGLTYNPESGGDINRLVTAEVLCTKCIDHYMVPKVSAVWDTERNRWVSAVYVKSEIQLATSPDLKVWTPKPWLQGKLATLIELFAIEVKPKIANSAQSQCQWVLVFKETDAYGVTSLRHTFFVPDDTDQMVVEKGILDWGNEWEELSIITVNSSRSSTISFIGVVGVDYVRFGIHLQNVLLARQFHYVDGQLTQSLAKSYYDNPGLKFIKFEELIYKRGDDPLAGLRPSRSFHIRAEFDVGPSEFGFEIYVSPHDCDYYGADLTVFRYYNYVEVNRYFWLPDSQSDNITSDPLGQIVIPYTTSGKVKVECFADEALIEFFVNDGIVAGSIFTFPDENWNRYRIYSKEHVKITNLELKIFDNIQPKTKN